MCWFPAFSLPGLSPRGNEALILLAIHQGLVHPCFSEEMLEEYAAVLARPKFAFPPDEIPPGEIAAVLAMFRQQGELYHPTAALAASVDPGDTKFLQYAEGVFCASVAAFAVGDV